MKRRLAVVVLLLIVASALSARTAAQGQVEVQSSSARSDFPNGIVFALDAESGTGLDEVRLVYRIAPDGVRTTAIAE